MSTSVTLSLRTGATFTGIEDTYFNEFSTSVNNTQPDFRVSGSTTFARQHALIKFPSLTADISGPVTVVSATLKLTTGDTVTASPVINFYRLLNQSILSQSDWFQRNSTGPTLWTNQGAYGTGDTDTTLICSVTPTAAYTEYSITSANLTQYVQDVINGVVGNYGLLAVMSVDSDSAETRVNFTSSEGYNNYEYPELTVVYDAAGGTSKTVQRLVMLG